MVIILVHFFSIFHLWSTYRVLISSSRPGHNRSIPSQPTQSRHIPIQPNLRQTLPTPFLHKIWKLLTFLLQSIMKFRQKEIRIFQMKLNSIILIQCLFAFVIIINQLMINHTVFFNNIINKCYMIIFILLWTESIGGFWLIILFWLCYKLVKLLLD